VSTPIRDNDSIFNVGFHQQVLTLVQDHSCNMTTSGTSHAVVFEKSVRKCIIQSEAMSAK